MSARRQSRPSDPLPTRKETATVISLPRLVIRAAALFALLGAASSIAAATASAASPTPAWTITTMASPSHFTAGEADFYEIQVTNTGGVASSGAPITITDVLPPGLALAPNGYQGYELEAWRFRNGADESQTSCVDGPPVSCTIVSTVVRPGEVVWMEVPVEVEPGTSGTVTNQVSVSGGDAAATTASERTLISSEASPFAFQSLTSRIGDSSGAAETRAGAHPYRLQLGFQLQTNLHFTPSGASAFDAPGGSPRVVSTVLPSGLVVNPEAVPARCTEAQFTHNVCPIASVVGVAQITQGGFTPFADPFGSQSIFDMVAPPGVAAELAFNAGGLNFPVHILGGVDAAGNYTLSAKASEILQYGNASGTMIELWGNPSDPSHNGSRGPCVLGNTKKPEEGGEQGVLKSCSTDSSNVPFITMPSQCSGPLTTAFGVESWQGGMIEASVETTDPSGNPVGVGGCGKLEFHPTLEAQPTTRQPDSPTGLQVNLHLPQNNQIAPVQGEYPPANEVQQVAAEGTSGEFTLSFMGESTPFMEPTVSAAEVQTKLEGLSTIKAHNVSVTKEHPAGSAILFHIEFVGALADQNVRQMQLVSNKGSGGIASVYTLIEGHHAGEKGELGTEAALSSATLENLTVTLPKGLVVNPSAADGQGACSLAQIGYQSQSEGHLVFSGDQPSCPDDSKLGTVSLITPLLDHPLPGSIYLAKQGENPFGSLIALYVVIDDPISGVVVKLAGKVTPDPATGQLTATFRENPQLPFEELKTEFFGGPRAALTTPSTCGTYTTTSDLTPWSSPQGADAYPTDSFTIGSGCASGESQAPNAPSFEAGTATPLAGTYSPFVLKLSRENGTQRFSSIDATLPLGLLGKLADIPYCSDAQIAAAAARSNPGEGALERANPSCPLASEVGTVTVGAGSGSPLYVQGHAYLAGPYRGAPLSLAIITPAVAGPFDLGVVVVRTTLYVNEETAQITAKSDPIPTILQGIPLDVRSVALSINRQDFTLNPTNCNAMSVLGTAMSTQGQAAQLSDRFQVGGCKGLEFKPSLKLQLKGATKRTGHPALKAVLTYPKGEGYANIARAQVGLPHSLFLDQGNLNKVCKQAELKAATCPKSSIYGHVKAWTPLLEKPLEGPVYLGVGYGYKLPALVADLRGQIRILLVGKVDTTKQKGLRNTFEVVPDAPVSRFVLEMKGGKKYSLLENSENLCAKKQEANARFIAQNGAVSQQHPVISRSCKKGNKNK